MLHVILEKQTLPQMICSMHPRQTARPRLGKRRILSQEECFGNGLCLLPSREFAIFLGIFIFDHLNDPCSMSGRLFTCVVSYYFGNVISRDIDRFCFVLHFFSTLPKSSHNFRSETEQNPGCPFLSRESEIFNDVKTHISHLCFLSGDFLTAV